MPLGPGSRLDAYELVSPLGKGGMGEVWLATEVRLGRKVALKLLPAELTQDFGRVSRFEQEARAASALSHPNVCTILALGQSVNGQQYIAMEYIEGETLRKHLATSHPGIREALDIAVQIAAALSAAHAAGIVHRDIKPENVMLRPDGFAKVLDFGLAKLVAATQAGEGQATHTALSTEAGRIVGTVAYMSPEQTRGQPVDARTDIWSLGCVLYEMVAGRSPFAAATSSDILAGILEREPPPMARLAAEVPAELQRIVTKALRKDRAHRYQATQDLMLDLQALRDDLQMQARSGSSPSLSADSHQPIPEQKSTPRAWHGVRTGLVAAVVVAGVGLIAGAAWWWNRSNVPNGNGPSITVSRNLTRLTFGSGLQTDATFSPDGRFVAYASNRAGNFDIWVQPVAGGDPVQVTKSTADDTQPDWSPDGNTLAFHSERDGGGVYVVAALGGGERRIASAGEQPMWSPDGNQILFLKGVTIPGIGPPTQYVVYSIRDDHETELWPGRLIFNVAWRPDGRVSAVGMLPRETSLDIGLFTGGVDGSSIVYSALAADWPDAIRQAFPNAVSRLRWSSNGRQLFMQVSSDDVESIWRISVNPNTLAFESFERLTVGAERQSGLGLSHDGTRLAYTAQSDVTRLWRLPADVAAGRIKGVPAALTDEEGEVATFDVSSDGTRVAYELRHSGSEHREFRVLDLRTGTTSQIAGGGSRRRQPRWSPDGHRLAYHLIRQRAEPDNALAVWDTITPERIVARPRQPFEWLAPFDWTPDGQFVLVSRVGPRQAVELWTADSDPPAAEAAKVLMRDTGSFIWQQRYSPDGRWLSFVSVPEVQGGIPTVQVAPVGDLRPAQWRQVAPAFAWTDKPRWAPDGSRLYFIARNDAVFNVWTVRFDRNSGRQLGAPQQVTHFYPPDLTISPDVDKVDFGVAGDFLVVPLKHVAGSIWILDNVDK